MILSDLMLFLAITVNCVIWTALKEGKLLFKKPSRRVPGLLQLPYS